MANRSMGETRFRKTMWCVRLKRISMEAAEQESGVTCGIRLADGQRSCCGCGAVVVKAALRIPVTTATRPTFSNFLRRAPCRIDVGTVSVAKVKI